MKKALVALLALGLVGSLAYGQGLTGKGIKVGLNLANVSGDDIEDNKMQLGFAFGAFITYSFNEMFAIQPEVLYSMKGFKIESDEEYGGVTASYEQKNHLNYLEIPVLFKFMPKMEGSFAPNIFAGPALGIKMSATYDAEITIDGQTESSDGDLEDIKSIDFGLAFGAGADFEVGPGKVTFDARYTLGLSTIDDSEAEADVKNGVITFMLGYSF